MNRRKFLGLSGAAAMTPAAGVLASCGVGAAGGASRSGSRRVRLGFIALTDCASLVMADQLGLFAARDLEVTVEKQASWPATRDALLTGRLDGAHCLYSLPLSVAAGVGGAGSTELQIAMMLSNNGQGINLSRDLLDAGYGDLDRLRDVLSGEQLTFAMTYPGGTHDLWLRYWLRAAGVDAAAHRIIAIPPPQMVANMKVGAVHGYSVGAPWNAVAVDQEVGFTTMNSQDIWQHHPEKALVVTSRFATERRQVLADVMAAVLEASAWLDDLDNRDQVAEVIAATPYVNAEAASIVGQLNGRYDLGGDLGERRYDEDLMLFHRDGAVNPPRRGHAIWALAQYRRLGLVDHDPPYRELADSLVLRELYEEVAATEGLTVPDDDMAPFEIQLDGASFDPSSPEQEVARP